MKEITMLNNFKPVEHTGSGVPIYLYSVSGRKRPLKATKVDIREMFIWHTEEEVNLVENYL